MANGQCLLSCKKKKNCKLEEDIKDVRQKVGDLYRGLSVFNRQIQKGEPLRDVLALVLKVGNYVNKGGKQGVGFKLRSADALNNLTAVDNSTNMLRVVAGIMSAQKPEIFAYLSDLLFCEEASKVDATSLAGQIVSMDKSLNSSKDNIIRFAHDYELTPGVKDLMLQCIEAKQAELIQLSELESKSKAISEELRVVLGLSKAEGGASEMLQQIADIAKSLKEADASNKLKERDEKIKLEREERRQREELTRQKSRAAAAESEAKATNPSTSASPNVVSTASPSRSTTDIPSTAMDGPTCVVLPSSGLTGSVPSPTTTPSAPLGRLSDSDRSPVPQADMSVDPTVPTDRHQKSDKESAHDGVTQKCVGPGVGQIDEDRLRAASGDPPTVTSEKRPAMVPDGLTEGMADTNWTKPWGHLKEERIPTEHLAGGHMRSCANGPEDGGRIDGLSSRTGRRKEATEEAKHERDEFGYDQLKGVDLRPEDLVGGPSHEYPGLLDGERRHGSSKKHLAVTSAKPVRCGGGYRLAAEAPCTRHVHRPQTAHMVNATGDRGHAGGLSSSATVRTLGSQHDVDTSTLRHSTSALESAALPPYLSSKDPRLAVRSSRRIRKETACTLEPARHPDPTPPGYSHSYRSATSQALHHHPPPLPSPLPH